MCRPEFLNRLDEIIVFRQLTKLEVKQIADIMLNEVFMRAETKGIKIDVTERFKVCPGHTAWTLSDPAALVAVFGSAKQSAGVVLLAVACCISHAMLMTDRVIPDHKGAGDCARQLTHCHLCRTAWWTRATTPAMAPGPSEEPSPACWRTAWLSRWVLNASAIDRFASGFAGSQQRFPFNSRPALHSISSSMQLHQSWTL